MASYRLSRKARSDLADIARHSARQWGIARAEAYLAELQDSFARLAAFPQLGRDAGHIRAGYRQVESASHVVFYRADDRGILIVRVLHQSMRPDLHL